MSEAEILFWAKVFLLVIIVATIAEDIRRD